jgi:hypothetical protein
LPTNWGAFDFNQNGVTGEVVGTGTENGLSDVDLNVSGTPTASAGVSLTFDGATQVVASDGQTWSGSVFVKIASGSTSGIDSLQLALRGLTSAGGDTGQNFNVTITPTASGLSAQRFSIANTLSHATIARVLFGFGINYASGQQIGGSASGLTLRIAAPQLEQGAFPTSYIPTTTATATRAADFAKIDGISSFYNAAEGSVYTEHTQLVAKTSGSVNKFPWVMNFGANAAYPILGVYAQNQSTDTFLRQAIKIDSAGPVTQAEQGATLALTAGTIHKFIAGYATNNVATYRNGSAGGTDDTVDLSGTTGMERMGIGNLYRDTIGDDYLNGHIRKIAYWPKRLTNTLLEQLTT